MLLDTSGLFNLVHRPEPYHAKACELYETARVRLTHNYILAEFIPLSRVRKYPDSKAAMFIRDIATDPEIEMVWVDEALHHQAVSLLQLRVDKGYSLCDAVSFILMRRYGVTDALTTDRHFEQEGFHRLLV